MARHSEAERAHEDMTGHDREEPLERATARLTSLGHDGSARRLDRLLCAQVCREAWSAIFVDRSGGFVAVRETAGHAGGAVSRLTLLQDGGSPLYLRDRRGAGQDELATRLPGREDGAQAQASNLGRRDHRLAWLHAD